MSKEHDLTKRSLLRIKLQNDEYVLELAKVDVRFASRSHECRSGLWDKETRKHVDVAMKTLARMVALER